ncbi:MAG: DUF2027 domain-containing protein [Bacteroidales bacterium]|nr:DUF2027 domain-containing protein [Bacteroidales bacterium]MBN2749165.1 DUF2027 domain-containing protein [Bacteroidales bacterium]
MRCSVGDKVRFLNDVGGGKVVRLIDKRMVLVETEDGFEMPVLDSELIVIDSVSEQVLVKSDNRHNVPTPQKGNRNKTAAYATEEDIDDDFSFPQQLSRHQPLSQEKDPDGDSVALLLAFVPTNQQKKTDSDQNLYIVNDSSYRVAYSVALWAVDEVKPIASGVLMPDTKELLHNFSREELTNQLVINVQSLFFKNRNFVVQQPEFYDLNINPAKFYKEGAYTDNDFFEEKAIVYSVADTRKEEILKSLSAKAIHEAIKEKEKPLGNKTVKPKLENADTEEIDLHIHELIENPKGLEPVEILDIQMARFTTALEGGIKASTKKMVFIHGVGNGKLKHEIRKVLDKQYGKYRYQDASFKEYGFGATIVFLR